MKNKMRGSGQDLWRAPHPLGNGIWTMWDPTMFISIGTPYNLKNNIKKLNERGILRFSIVIWTHTLKKYPRNLGTLRISKVKFWGNFKS